METELRGFQRDARTNEMNIFNSSVWLQEGIQNFVDTEKLGEEFLKKNSRRQGYEEFSTLPYISDEFKEKANKLSNLMRSKFGATSDNPMTGGIDYSDFQLLKYPKKSKSLNKERMPSINYNHAEHEVSKSKLEIKEEKFERPYKGRRKKRGDYLQDASLSKSKRPSDLRSRMLPTMTSTGTLVPPLLPSEDSMDIIIGSSWIFPTKAPVLSPEMYKCVISNNTSGSQKSEVFKKCLKGQEFEYDEDYLNTEEEYDPFSLKMGATTIIRLSVRCICNPKWLDKGEIAKCGKFLPYHDQAWPAFMGSRGNSVF